MGRRLAIETPHGAVGGWLADPSQPARGALVVVQEIFGVNAHMRSVTERYARDGYLALVPAMFDPVERNVDLAYDESGFEHGRALASALGFERAVAVVAAAAGVLRALSKDADADTMRVGVVGFCWATASPISPTHGSACPR